MSKGLNMSGGSELNYRVKLDIDDAFRNAEKLKRAFQEVNQESAKQSKVGSSTTSNNYTKVQVEFQEALRKARLEMAALKVEEQKLANQSAASAAATSELTRKIAANRLEQQELTKAARLAREANKATAGSYKEAQERLTALGKEIKNTTGGFNSQSPALKAKIREYNDLNEKLKTFDATMGNHQRKVGSYQLAINGAAGSLAAWATGFLSIGTILSQTFDQSLRSDAIRTSLEFTFGSVELADAKLEQLGQTADRLGVNYNALTTSYKSFTGAVIASNFNFEEGERIFNAVSGAASRLKLSSQDTEGALRALQQMISKGNVQAEELRGQLGERIPGAFSIAARAMGVTETQLNKMLQKGEVLAADLLPKLATELEKTFNTNSTEQVDGLSAAWERLKNVFSTTVGETTNINRFFTTIIDGVGRAAKSIVAMVNSSSWTEFTTRLFKNDDGKTADVVKAINLSGEKGEKTYTKAFNLDVDKANAKTILTTYEEVKIAYNNAKKALEDYKASVATGALKDGGKRSVQSLTDTVDLLNSQMTRLKRFIPESPVFKAEKSSKQIASEKAEARKAESALNAQRALQREIDELNAKGKRKSLSNDQEEIEAVKAKYQKLIEKAIAFNKAKNNIERGLKVNTSGLVEGQSSEIDALIDKQASVKLKKSIDEQKSLYKDFEQYKSDFGLAKAKERFKDQLDTEVTFLERLKIEREKITDPQKSKGSDQDEVKAEEQLKVLDEQIAEETKAQQKKYDDLLKQFMDYSQKREVLIENYNKDFADLNNNPKEQAERTKVYERELKELDDANAKKLSSYEELFIGIESLSKRNALKLLEQARTQLAKDIRNKVIVDPAEIAKVKKYFSDVEATIKNGSGQALIDLANKIDGVVSLIGNANSAFGKMLTTVSNVVGQVGNIKKSLGDFNKAGASGLDKLGAGFSIATAGFSIIKSLFNLFDRSAEREAQASYSRDLQNKQADALNKALERQVALLDEVYGTEKIKRYDEAIKLARENQAKYAAEIAGRFALTGDKNLDSLISQLNNGEKAFLNGIPLSKKGIEEMRAQLEKFKLPSGLEELRTLLNNGKLDAGTAVIVENLIKAQERAKELVNSLNAEKIGANLNQIADDFISTLTDGTRDFGKTFEQTIQKSILNGFKGELIRKQLQTFYDQFAELSSGGLTADEIEILRKSYINASEKAKQDLDALSKATGIDLNSNSNTSNSNSLKGAYSTASQESISLLAGQTSGMRLAQLQTNALLMPIGRDIGELYKGVLDNFGELVKIEANTRRTADNTEPLKDIKVSLQSIDKKVSSGNNALVANGR